MGGPGQRGQEQAIYYPGTGGQFAGAPSGQIPAGAFRWFAQSTARYGGLPGGGGAGRIPMSAVPREWIGDPRYAGFMSWMREQGILQPDLPTEYETTPLPPPGALEVPPPGALGVPAPVGAPPGGPPTRPEGEGPEAPFVEPPPPGPVEPAEEFFGPTVGGVLGGALGGVPEAPPEVLPEEEEEEEEEEFFPGGGPEPVPAF